MLYILYFRKLYLRLVNAVLYLYLVDAILFLIEAYKQSELIINHSFRLLLNRNICTPAESISSMCICLLILYLACVEQQVYLLADSIASMCIYLLILYRACVCAC